MFLVLLCNSISEVFSVLPALLLAGATIGSCTYPRPNHSYLSTSCSFLVVVAVMRSGIVTDVHYDRHFGFILDAETSERHFFHLSEVQQTTADTTTAADAGATANKQQQQQQRHSSRTGDVRDAAAPLIVRGQEVSYTLGQRQGKTVGLLVQLLPKGSVTMASAASSKQQQQQQQQGVSGHYVGVVANASAAATGRDAAVQGILVSLYMLSDSTGRRGSATSASGDTAAASDDVSGDVAHGDTPAEANGSANGKCSYTVFKCSAKHVVVLVLCRFVAF
jgi:cold shock CspA family protein